MKRLLTIVAVLCLLLGCVHAARAEITVTVQPETQTVKVGGSVTFSAKAKGVGQSGITWHFLSPDGQEDVTGRKLSGRFSGLKVSNPNTLNIRLKNVPEEMHGWSVYCHLGKSSAGVDTEKALLLIEGMDAPGAEETAPEGQAGAADGAVEETEETGAAEADGDNLEAGETAEDASEEADSAEADGEEPEAGETAEDASEEAGETPAETGTFSGSIAGTAAENEQIRGFAEGKQEYQYLQLGTYYYGENGEKEPLLWRILYRKGNIAQLITEHVIDAMQMLNIDDFYTAVKKRNYRSRYNTPYEETDIYYWLNGEMAKVIFEQQDFSPAVVPHRIKEVQKKDPDVAEEPGYQPESGTPLTAEEKERYPYGKDLFYLMTYADMKNGAFGFPDTTMGNTKENDNERAVPESGRRKAFATPYAKAKVQHPDWKKQTKQYKLDVVTVYKGMGYGGSSPYWAVKRRMGYYMSGIVGANGHLSWSNMASVRIGVRPAAIIDLSRLRVTGGNGTLENPWRFALAEGVAGGAGSGETEEAGQ